MKIVANVEMSFKIVQKHALFFIQIRDAAGNLLFEEECLTRQGACARAGTFVAEALLTPE